VNKICRDFVHVSFSDWSFTDVFLFKDAGSHTERLLPYVDIFNCGSLPSCVRNLINAVNTEFDLGEQSTHFLQF